MAHINDYALITRGHHRGKIGYIINKYPIVNGHLLRYDILLETGVLIEDISLRQFTSSKNREKLTKILV